MARKFRESAVTSPIMDSPRAHEYFTDRESGPRPPTQREIERAPWEGLLSHIRVLIDRGDFGNSFPQRCSDSSSHTVGTNFSAFVGLLKAEVPLWPGWHEDQPALPDVGTACDVLEFCHARVAQASPGGYHPYFDHDHLEFDVPAGQSAFREQVNLILRRNAIALRFADDGRMERILDDPTGRAIRRAVFRTGDVRLDQLLEEARTKFLDPSPQTHQEALERIWDAWERLKTVRNTDKKLGTVAILDVCATGAFRKVLEEEATAITALGNHLQIRHFETNKPEIVDPDYADYLFQRMFALVLLILRRNNMLG